MSYSSRPHELHTRLLCPLLSPGVALWETPNSPGMHCRCHLTAGEGRVMMRKSFVKPWRSSLTLNLNIQWQKGRASVSAAGDSTCERLSCGPFVSPVVPGLSAWEWDGWARPWWNSTWGRWAGWVRKGCGGGNIGVEGKQVITELNEIMLYETVENCKYYRILRIIFFLNATI